MNKIRRKSKSFISLLIVAVLILGMGIQAVYAQSAVISDIGNHWAKKEISAWVSEGLITGYADGTFKPNNSITRAEFIALVNRLFAFSEKASVPFTDVKETDWFYADFAKASKAGYLVGYEGGKVEPNGFITRQEVATIAAKVKSMQEDAAGANGFADAASIPALYKGFIGAVVNAKVMNGYPDGKFEPVKGITRAESVITLNRLISIPAIVKSAQSVQIEAIKDQSLRVGVTGKVDLKLLTAGATVSMKNSDGSVVDATLTGTTIQLKGLKVGTSTITVTGKKDGMPDGVVTFKVTVYVASSGGGGGGSHSGGGSGPTANDSRLTAVKAVVGVQTLVTGKYDSAVKTIEVIYGSTKLTPSMNNGNFSCSINPGLEIGDNVTVKGYAGSKLLDTDEVNVVEDDAILTELKAVGTKATQISGKYASGVTRVELVFGNVTVDAKMESGTFSWNIAPGLASGTSVTAKAYVGGVKVDIDQVQVGGATPAPYISNFKAIGTKATQISGNYANGVTRVELVFGNVTVDAKMESGTFTWNIAPGLASGTSVTAKAYVEAQLVATENTTVGGTNPSEEHYLTNVTATAFGTLVILVTGNYDSEITSIEVLYSSYSKPAALDNGTFSYEIVPPDDATITTVTLKAYAGEELKETLPVNVQ